MKLALIGTGKIIEDALFAMEPVKTIERTAVFARPHSRDKAEKLAKQYAIKEVYTDYEELLKKTEADTVYIGLVNSAHYPYAKQALLAGKNVILEKPFTGFYEETKELAQIANEKKLFIFEAITVLHNEVFYEMKKNLNKLGNIRMALCNYSQYSSRYDAYLEGDITHSFDPAYYGGSLYDINVYNVHYCVGLFGEPKNATYYPNVGPNGIDTSGTLVMEYDGFSAVCTGSKDSYSPGYEKVKDAAGAIVRATITEEYKAPEHHHRMTQEFTDFARMIDEKDYETAKEFLDETVAVVKVLETARKKAGIES